MPEPRDEGGDADVDERVVQGDLPGRGGQEVLAAENMGHAHERIVDRVHERVERLAVRPHDDEVGRGALRERDLAANEVVEAEVACRYTQAERRLAALRFVRGDLLGCEVALEVVVALLGVAAVRDVAGLHLLGGDEALVEVARRLEALGHVGIDVHALRLAVRCVGPPVSTPSSQSRWSQRSASSSCR